MQAVRSRIKGITAPRHRLPEPIAGIVTEVNRLRRGWRGYFRVGNSTRHFRQVDRYVCIRSELFLRKKTGKRWRDWTLYSRAFVQRLGVYRLSGTVGWATATPSVGR